MTVRILRGDVLDKLATLPDESVHCVVTSPLDLAYCAGIIDADGTIGIKRSTYAMRVRGDAGAPVFSERICVKQVTSEAVDLLKSLFGGRRGIDNPSAKRGKPLHVWQVTDRQAVVCLRAILPYLRIKRAQAENCLALREVKEQSKVAKVARGRGHAGAAARPAHLTEAMERHYAAAKALNIVGAR